MNWNLYKQGKQRWYMILTLPPTHGNRLTTFLSLRLRIQFAIGPGWLNSFSGSKVVQSWSVRPWLYCARPCIWHDESQSKTKCALVGWRRGPNGSDRGVRSHSLERRDLDRLRRQCFEPKESSQYLWLYFWAQHWRRGFRRVFRQRTRSRLSTCE